MLTSIYPSPDFTILNSTSVCHYFTKEWVKMGHSVTVIYNYPQYNKMLHRIALLFGKKIANVMGAGSVAVQCVNKPTEYFMDGVRILRIPLYKILPRIAYSRKSIRRQVYKIVDDNVIQEFVPDVIIAHFHRPGLDLIKELKPYYPLARTAIILHGSYGKMQKVYESHIKEYMDLIDVWGYRAKSIKDGFENQNGIPLHSFLCYSGVPSIALNHIKSRNIDKVNKFIYVGALIKQKHPETIILALSDLFPKKDFTLTFVGDGEERKSLIKIAQRLNVDSCISFLGKIDREQVFVELDKADCFIMLSERETFGLVYLEAMARGCLTIASKDEGMDGIIIDKENGFLGKAGSKDSLVSIVKSIQGMPAKERQQISQNAIKTAESMVDSEMAKRYINNVLN